MITKKKNHELFHVENLRLEFGKLTVLNNTSFFLNTGEIHALVGEHGAGKSSLAKIISGFQTPDSGSLFFKNKILKKFSVPIAKQFGIEMVTQNIPLFSQFTVANNILIDKAPFLLRNFNHKKIENRVEAFFKEQNILLNPKAIVSDLNLSDRVMVDFCKHVFNNPKLLILDETLEQLSNLQLQKVIPLLHNLKDQGCSILFITHRVDDIYEIADKVSVMRDGNILITEDIKNIDKINLIRLAYTQVIKEHSKQYLKVDFYNLLKYNEAILTLLPFTLLITDTKRNIRLINEAAKIHFNLKKSNHLNISLKTLLGDNNLDTYNLLRDSINAERKEYFYNLPMHTEMGASSQNICILPLFDDKLFIGNIITMEDVTDYENLRRQLSLSENLASLGLLAAGVAHEINNPLEIINFYIQNLKLTNPNNEKIVEIVNDVGEEIVTISKIIENLLLFSEDKKQIKEKVEINNLLGGIVHLISKSAESRNISIDFKCGERNIFVNAVKTELKQVFLNILKNSIEAINENGKIEIVLSIKTSMNGSSNVEIIFMDNGPGIDKEILNKVFMPFYSTKNYASGNMGLGLSISYNIVKKYDGSMIVRNRKLGGCETLLIFPFIGE